MLLSATGFKVIWKVSITFQLQYFAVGLLRYPSFNGLVLSSSTYTSMLISWCHRIQMYWWWHHGTISMIIVKKASTNERRELMTVNQSPTWKESMVHCWEESRISSRQGLWNWELWSIQSSLYHDSSNVNWVVGNTGAY